ncbi:MAG: nuclear transport factor 2 family protein [Actinomycetes bacterium]
MTDAPLASAHEALYDALNVMLTGDAGPIQAVWSTGDDASYAGPFGGFITGGAAVAQEFGRSAAMHLGGRIEDTDVIFVEGADLGYTVCVEHGIDHVINGEKVNLTHRATNIFRREPHGWRLVHHHTDPS